VTKMFLDRPVVAKEDLRHQALPDRLQTRFREQIRVLQQHPETYRRFTTLRKRVFPIFPSQYDITNVCNLNCVGCLYFDGDDVFDGKPETDPYRLDRFFEAESRRGVNYAHFAGAEPALNQAALLAASRHIPRGVVYTNGHRKIDPSVPFRLHISIWTIGEKEALLRGNGVFAKALENYAGDPRAVFVLTLSRQSVEELEDVALICAEYGVQLAFNQYSPTVDATAHNRHLRKSQISEGAGDLDLFLRRDELKAAYARIGELQDRYSDTIRFSPAYAAQMTKPGGLYETDPSTGFAVNCASRLSYQLRHFMPDLSELRDTKCCSPNINCSTCGLYSMAFATMIDELGKVPAEISALEAWMDVTELWESLFC